MWFPSALTWPYDRVPSKLLVMELVYSGISNCIDNILKSKRGRKIRVPSALSKHVIWFTFLYSLLLEICIFIQYTIFKQCIHGDLHITYYLGGNLNAHVSFYDLSRNISFQSATWDMYIQHTSPISLSHVTSWYSLQNISKNSTWSRYFYKQLIFE